MPGGLIQLASYGAQDIFLTGNPEITFFKIVYRRHTNFSIESIEESFEGIVNFGETLHCTLSNPGDLVYRMYLRVELPEINLIRPLDQTAIATATTAYNTAVTNYTNLQTYAGFILGAYNLIQTELLPVNANPANIAAEVNFYFNAEIDIVAFNNISLLIASLIVNSTNINQIITDISNNNSLSTSQKLNAMRAQSLSIYNYLQSNNNSLYALVLTAQNTLNDLSNTNYNFAWIDRIGHFIYDNIELQIAGQRIDQHFSDWINIWYELTNNFKMQSTYNKMIGDIPALTTYNRATKPLTVLNIPLYFSFCRNNTLALPVVAMRYCDVQIVVKLNPVEHCVITDYNNSGNTLTNILELNNISLFVDYVFLDNEERRKFAQSVHEYLFEQVQVNTFTGIQTQSFTCPVRFFYPCKEIIWFVKKAKTVNIYNLSTDPLFGVYSTNTDGTNNPIKSANIQINGVDRFNVISGNYFNYVQPYENWSNTPADGINVYTFALYPEEHQPSGTCNFTRINYTALNTVVTDAFMATLSGSDTYDITVYAVNYNILRIMGGLAGTAFSL
ncbi:MAG: NCLDV major capsid protein [Faunusvirus sp.]|uniref:NCLDV major capsid protein n=1 Tax=Faunusvirus sp. TaxID=2487766 RepID=A0A3G5A008_9VIRU|nr:MAG: NCLDV major capsid protein [Faunusvirus sp.]